MGMLSKSSSLIMPVSSNLKVIDDQSWWLLFPDVGSVVCIGAPAATLRDTLTRAGFDLLVLTEGSPVPLIGSIVGIIVVTDSESWVMEVGPAVHERLIENGVVVHLAHAASGPWDKVWMHIEQPSSVSRLSHLAQLGLKLAKVRIAHVLLGRTPRLARRHASDVGFVAVPDDLRTRREQNLHAFGFDSPTPPPHLTRLASANEVVLDASPWSFGPPRGFASQKVVFAVDSSRGPLIVKCTQESRFNHRLQSEIDALHFWADRDRSFDAPSPVFVGEHGGTLVHAQSAVSGRPFREVADPEPRGAHVASGVQALINMAELTKAASTEQERRAAMDMLVDRFIVAYDPPPGVREAVHGAAHRVHESGIPTVFMHGDFGVWNLLIAETERLGVLDWENSDPLGVPLWDLFVFMRTVGVFLADAQGVRYSDRTFSRQFLHPSAIQSVLFSAIGEYCRRVNVPESAVDDLFVMCWVDQSVRQAASAANARWLGTRSSQILAAALATPLGYRA